MRTAVITVASSARREHFERQRRVLAEVAADIVRVEAWLDETAPAGIQDAESLTLHVPPGPVGLRVGEGRNRAAEAAVAAGAKLLVFLDVDCLPGPDLLPAYRSAAAAYPDALLAGPVTYLASVQRPESAADLPFLTRPHRARPALPLGVNRRATAAEYDLFWSLSFAVAPPTWERIGGFAPVYEGYGAEDTDLAWSARARGVEMRWVGGADAYHQWHPVSSPPWQHLDDILRNGAMFHERWGVWPMSGWLEAFAAAGAIERRGGGWARVHGRGRQPR
ncbi:galactosyltransferase-related protein [Microbacterium trichothecenolyticum]|uniref:N-acetylglucosaminyl-diphospho-decaprenol L-rhamnosyltransferase n=1 Tax=Microbacterium trichothecenolyticum TaxID=69370 RepID=A0ABU0TZP9_MICTR|nr:galactosyltransferase-related protein [Microbacterium trichothecenolyticum]MDQ1124399.1 N-acetylglucosaminyl-diphospho-decaprenol L-rhamnosyltransferase [Microbacterium trichothecenolyticum]